MAEVGGVLLLITGLEGGEALVEEALEVGPSTQTIRAMNLKLIAGQAP